MEQLGLPRWQAPELISRGSKLNPWAYSFSDKDKVYLLTLYAEPNPTGVPLLRFMFRPLLMGAQACSHPTCR